MLAMPMKGLSFRELNLEDLPIFNGESAFHVPCEGLAGFGVTGVLEVVVADWEFSV